jgi:hypothetical protein
VTGYARKKTARNRGVEKIGIRPENMGGKIEETKAQNWAVMQQQQQ